MVGKWVELSDGIKVNFDWLYSGKNRQLVNSIDDNDDDDGEYVELTDDEVKKYFGH